MAPTTEKKRRGIPLQTVIIAMITISAIISFFLLYSMYRTTQGYSNMRTATEDYIDCQNSAATLQAASDYLTEQARLFVMTGDREHAILFFNEIETTRRRETAVENFGRHQVETRVLDQLTTALQLSNNLKEIELYAMRLAAEGIEDDISLYPLQVQQATLSEEDRALSPAEKLARGRDMMFDDHYENMKGQINARISLCLDQLVETMLVQQIDSSDRLFDLLHSQQLLICGLMFSLLIIAIIIFSMVISPLKRQINGISKEQLLDVEGTSELQFLATTYNTMFEQNRRTHEKLNFEATHDPLTGLYNRSAYDHMRAECRDEGIALVLVDVDYFKQINDTYGHDMGDRVLRRVAEVLQSSFRGEDMVCRIGGDEFSIIMVHADSSLTELVRGKMVRAAEKLANPTDDLPKVTLSVGVAFADQTREGEDLFKNADKALYAVKMNARNNCGFYQPEKATV